MKTTEHILQDLTRTSQQNGRNHIHRELHPTLHVTSYMQASFQQCFQIQRGAAMSCRRRLQNKHQCMCKHTSMYMPISAGPSIIDTRLRGMALRLANPPSFNPGSYSCQSDSLEDCLMALWRSASVFLFFWYRWQYSEGGRGSRRPGR